MHIRDQNNLVRSQIHIADLRTGMTVEVNGELITVNVKDHVSRCNWMGRSFQGDASKTHITQVQFAVPTAFGISLR